MGFSTCDHHSTHWDLASFLSSFLRAFLGFSFSMTLDFGESMMLNGWDQRRGRSRLTGRASMSEKARGVYQGESYWDCFFVVRLEGLGRLCLSGWFCVKGFVPCVLLGWMCYCDDVYLFFICPWLLLSSQLYSLNNEDVNTVLIFISTSLLSKRFHSNFLLGTIGLLERNLVHRFGNQRGWNNKAEFGGGFNTSSHYFMGLFLSKNSFWRICNSPQAVP